MYLLVIYNPKAGAGRAQKLLPQVKRYLADKGLKADIKLTSFSGHAIDLVAKADLARYDAVIASGGDGTQFEVLNGYMINPAKQKPSFGLIPNGTGNAFMKELNLEKSDWRQAIDIIALNLPRKIDIGKFTTNSKSYYFLNIVGVGFVSAVAKAAMPLKWMGNTAYTVATLRKLISLKSQKMTLELDGKTIEREGVFVEVANSTFTGTRFYIAPKAKLDDGLLDVILLNKISRLKLLKVFTSIYDGSHIQYPEIEYFQARHIKIEEEVPTELAPDGEILDKSPVEFECLTKAIPYLWRRIG